MGHRLAADQPSFVEQPRVGPVELLERVVAEDPGARLVGDAQHEGVAPTDGSRRRGDELVVGDGGVELGDLALGDAVAERGVDDDGDVDVRVFLAEAEDSVVELGETRHRATFGGDVRAVDDDEVAIVFGVAVGATGRCSCHAVVGQLRIQWFGRPSRSSGRRRTTSMRRSATLIVESADDLHGGSRDEPFGRPTAQIPKPGAAENGIRRTFRPSGRRALGRGSPWSPSPGCRTRRGRRGACRSRVP